MATPEGYAPLSPYLVTTEADRVLDFMVAAFEAEPAFEPHRRADGTLMHATLQMGAATVMLGHPGKGGEERTAMLYLFVENCDASYGMAVEAGAETVAAPATQIYGDRTAAVRDPGGNVWWLAQRVEDVDRAALSKQLLDGTA